MITNTVKLSLLKGEWLGSN